MRVLLNQNYEILAEMYIVRICVNSVIEWAQNSKKLYYTVGVARLQRK